MLGWNWKYVQDSIFLFEIKVWLMSMILSFLLSSKRTSFSQSNGLSRIKSATLCNNLIVFVYLVAAFFVDQNSIRQAESRTFEFETVVATQFLIFLYIAGTLFCSLDVKLGNSWAPLSLWLYLWLFKKRCAKESNIFGRTRFWGPHKPIIQELTLYICIEIQSTCLPIYPKIERNCHEIFPLF